MRYIFEIGNGLLGNGLLGKSNLQQKQRMVFFSCQEWHSYYPLPITKKRQILVPHQYEKCYKLLIANC